MTPQEFAAAQQQARIIGQSKQDETKQIALSIHSEVMVKIFLGLLDRWLEKHDYSAPTSNDLRWIARIAHRYSWYAPEAMGLCKLNEDHLAALGGLNQDNILSFEHLFSTPPKGPIEQP